MATARRQRTARTSPTASELNTVVAALRKKMGDKIVQNGNQIKQPFRIPTGVFQFDLATMGGIPHARISMVHGKKHSGKSMMADRCIMGAQQTMEGQVVKVDVEGTHENVWSEKIGVDTEKLLVVQPDCGEDAMDAVDALIHTMEVSLIVVDSLAALVPVKEQEAAAEDSLVAQQSRLISRMVRKVSAAQIAEKKRGHHVTVLLINQQRVQIGGYSPVGEAISLPGGKAVGYFTTLEWQMKNKENKDRNDGLLTVNDHTFTIEKNKLNGGYRNGEFRLIREASATDYGLTEGEVDDAVLMVSRAKNLGWLTGGGKAGLKLGFGDQPTMEASNTDNLIMKLYEDREYLWSLRTHLIANWAETKGMPGEFVNYLLTGELYE